MAEEVKKCTIVSGSPEYDISYLKENIDFSSYIIAADSGYLRLDEAGVKYDLIIADFDSSNMPDTDAEIKTFPVEKSATDTFNAVKYAVDKGFNDITVFFALGGRFDHSYSNILCLDYCRRQGVKCVLLNKDCRASLICDKAIIYKDYDWFSLFAFLEPCKGVRIQGAKYTPDFYGKESIDFEPGDQFGQSNFVNDDQCEISVEKGTLLLIECNN